MKDDIAGASPVEPTVRPCAWLREQRDEYEGRASLAPLMILGHSEVKPHSALHGATYEPLYDRTALEAAVAAERERCKKLEAWLQWTLDSCDDSPEWNFGTTATAYMRALLAGKDAPMPDKVA